MEICKHYVRGKCTRDKCRFIHQDNVCRSYFFTGRCIDPNCKKSHDYKEKIKCTETFEPSFKEPDLRIRINEPIYSSNEISIVKEFFWNKNVLAILEEEVKAHNYVSWHGDSHLIANDSLNWKENSPTFNTIVKNLCDYFDMIPGATRLNYYTNSSDWKPYHHDAAAFRPDKAKTQNITVGVSFGLTREISFESADKDKFHRKTINFVLPDNTIYAFGNDVNIRFRHGIPQLQTNVEESRISIIVWGYSNYLNQLN